MSSPAVRWTKWRSRINAKYLGGLSEDVARLFVDPSVQQLGLRENGTLLRQRGILIGMRRMNWNAWDACIGDDEKSADMNRKLRRQLRRNHTG
jgi:hypothetical protein